MKGLLLVTMEPPAPLEEEFNDWYDTEHFPQRRGLPGFESASRWVCVHGWPRYVALYDLASIDALNTPEYAAVSGPNSTPWSRRVLPRTTGRARVIAEQIAPGDAVTLDPASTAQLVIARHAQPIDATAPNLPGLLQHRLFRTQTGQTYRIAAFDRPHTTDRLHDHFAAAPVQNLNIYAAYHRG